MRSSFVVALVALLAVASLQAAPTAFAQQYIGAKACAECHPVQSAAWRGSDHELSMQAADAKSVLGDFAGARFAYAGVMSTFFKRDGRFFARTDGPDGKLGVFEIKYTFGVRPLQQYLIEMPGGRLQSLGIAWDTRPTSRGGQRWFHLYPDRKLKAGDPLHWTGVEQTWNFQCAECHSTNLRKGFDAMRGTYDTKWSELNVACEACHGPGARHVAWARSGAAARASDSSKGLAIELDERKGVSWLPVAETGNAKRSAPRTRSTELATCGRCHARGERLSDDYRFGAPMLDSHRLSLLDQGLFSDDGQLREEVFEWAPFVQSRMHALGVTCSDCHDPHSLKLRASGNGVCAQCHAPAKYASERHTHHASGTSGAACAACHMPTTTFMGVDARHDHSLRVPRPDLSVKLQLPNACNRCHTGKSARWAAESIRKWTGKAPAGYQSFAEAFYAGRLRAPSARHDLAAIIGDPAQPAIVRASAIERIAPLLTPALLDLVAKSLADSDPLVRLAAVEALGTQKEPARLRLLVRMATDPVRAVRIASGRALAGVAEVRFPAAERGAVAAALDEYIAVQMYNSDRPYGLVNLGNVYAARGEASQAAAAYRGALKLDPTHDGARVNLADLLRALGNEAEAEQVLRVGIKLSPRAAALHHALGLSLVRQKRYAEALKSFAQAVEFGPGNPRFAYVYAVALNNAGRPTEAVTLLRSALKLQPYDRELLFGLAHFSAATGARAEALRHAQLLVELEPDSAVYRQLARTLDAAPAR